MNIEEGTACCRKDAARGGNDIGKMKKVSEMRQKGFYRHYPSGGWPLYWLLLAYVVAGWFWPVVGWALLFYIIGTVATAFWRGRWWCGHVCPRGNMYLRLLSRYSPHRQIPPLVRTIGFRLSVVIVVFTFFGIGIYNTWGDISAMGGVFWRTILITTLIGIVLSFVYAPMTWCSFCPIGSLAAWGAPRKELLPKGFIRVYIEDGCEGKCLTCARVCPMQLTPYKSRSKTEGYLNPDCIKCGRCADACPHKLVKL